MSGERLPSRGRVEVHILHPGLDRGGSTAIVLRSTDDVDGEGWLKRTRRCKGLAGRRRGGFSGGIVGVIVVVVVISVLL